MPRHPDASHHTSESTVLLYKRELIAGGNFQLLSRNRSLELEHYRPIATRFYDGEVVCKEVHHYGKIKGGRVVEVLLNDE